MAITVTNVSRQSVTVTLDQPAFFTPQSGWKRSTVSFGMTMEGGSREVREVRKAIPTTLMIGPGQRVEGLHDSFPRCSQVPALVRAKVLVISQAAEQEADQESQP